MANLLPIKIYYIYLIGNKFSICTSALVFCLAMLFHNFAISQSNPLTPQDSVKRKNAVRYFELSLGQTLLFISDSKLEQIKNSSAVIVPTTAQLFFAEFRPTKKMKIPVFFNLPTQTKQFIVDGKLVCERASPTFGAGLQFRIF